MTVQQITRRSHLSRLTQVPEFHGNVSDRWHLISPPRDAARCDCPEHEGGVPSKHHPERCSCGRWRGAPKRSTDPVRPCRCPKDQPITDRPQAGPRWQVRWVDEGGAQRAKAFEHYWQAESALEELRAARYGNPWTPVYDRHGNPLGYIQEALIRHSRPTSTGAEHRTAA